MLENWSVIEADFYREYRLDLVEVISIISWRRFVMLLNGLSVDSLYRLLTHDENDVAGAQVVDGDVDEAAVERIFQNAGAVRRTG